MKTCSTCWKRWRCMESDREYACREYEKKARKRNGKKKNCSTYPFGVRASRGLESWRQDCIGRTRSGCSGFVWRLAARRHGGGNWGNDGDCTECCDVLEKTDE